MSILIKGMEMPKECDIDCPVLSTPVCPIKSWNAFCSVENGQRHPECPLIEVPPHGRLIDADALLADVRAHSESYFADDFAHQWVDVAPTIIEAEEGK